MGHSVSSAAPLPAPTLYMGEAILTTLKGSFASVPGCRRAFQILDTLLWRSRAKSSLSKIIAMYTWMNSSAKTTGTRRLLEEL